MCSNLDFKAGMQTLFDRSVSCSPSGHLRYVLPISSPRNYVYIILCFSRLLCDQWCAVIVCGSFWKWWKCYICASWREAVGVDIGLRYWRPGVASWVCVWLVLGKKKSLVKVRDRRTVCYVVFQITVGFSSIKSSLHISPNLIKVLWVPKHV